MAENSAENGATPNKTFAAREYQLELLEAAKKQNIIVCLGTGTGKTFISIKLIEHLARENDILRPFSHGAKRTFFLVNSGEFKLLQVGGGGGGGFFFLCGLW
jgi:superfamily II DNA or RNA helicase